MVARMTEVASPDRDGDAGSAPITTEAHPMQGLFTALRPALTAKADAQSRSGKKRRRRRNRSRSRRSRG